MGELEKDWLGYLHLTVVLQYHRLRVLRVPCLVVMLFRILVYLRIDVYIHINSCNAEY